MDQKIKAVMDEAFELAEAGKVGGVDVDVVGISVVLAVKLPSGQIGFYQRQETVARAAFAAPVDTPDEQLPLPHMESGRDFIDAMKNFGNAG